MSGLDLGLDPPTVMPAHDRPRGKADHAAPVSDGWSKPATSYRQSNTQAVSDTAPEILDATPQGEEQPATAGWVSTVRNWTPPPDLAIRTVLVDYAVEKLIQSGKVGALVAAGGTGKTTLLLTLGICHATGRDFLGIPVKHGTFVHLSIDDSQDDLDGALALVMRAMKLTPDECELVFKNLRVISLQGEPGLKTFTTKIGGASVATGLEEMLLQAVDGIPNLVGIALDTLRQFSGGNSNDEEVIKHTVSGATEVAFHTGAYVIVPHHTGKQNYRDGVADMYCGSGSAAIADNCRFVLLLQTTRWSDIEAKVQRTGQERGDPLVLTSTRGSLLVRAPEPVFLHRDGFHIGRVAGAALSINQQADEKARAVIRAVRRGAQTKNAIAAAVRGNKSAALSLIDELIDRGLLRDGSENGSGNRPKLIVTGDGSRFVDDDL